jgi:parvulin-like peptidyl-prolyl isomerase
MLVMKWNLSLIIFSLLTASTFAAPSNDPVVAVVNGKKIKKSALVQYHQQNLSFVKAMKSVTLQSSLDDLINRILGVELAKKNELDKNPVVIKKMNDILYHAQISKDLEGELQKIKVSDKEVEKYYKNNPEYRTAHILYRLRINPSKDDVAKALEQSMAVYTEAIKKPDSFLDMASRFSQTTNVAVGGDLGYQPRTRLTPEYYAEIKGKKIGTITKPFRSQYGFHIVKILGVKTYEQINKDMYKKIIYDTKRDKILANYFNKLQNKAKITIDRKVLQSIK